MKKFTLSISEPCHEDWSNMTPDEKGRFCGSCKKTVVDFTNMSDRQLAEFFKKPVSSVCGRLHNDQLDRPIEIPKKRVPWVKYFFQFTWPAFVLFLKSCGQRTETMGITRLQETEVVTKKTVLLGGLTLQKNVSADTIKQKDITQPGLMGDVELVPEVGSNKTVMVDTTMVTVTNESPTTEMDTLVKLVTDKHCQALTETLLSGTVGMVSVSAFNGDEELKSVPSTQTRSVEISKIDVLLYPNPVMRGRAITVQVNDKIIGRYEVLSASGQLLRTQKLSLAEMQSVSINTSSWPGGTYFLRLVDENAKKVATQKFIVQ